MSISVQWSGQTYTNWSDLLKKAGRDVVADKIASMPTKDLIGTNPPLMNGCQNNNYWEKMKNIYLVKMQKADPETLDLVNEFVNL